MHPNSAQKIAAIIFNPHAGRGNASIVAKKSKRSLEQSNWKVIDTIASEYAGHIENTLAAEVGQRVQLVVIIGGDGTLREMVSGLRKAKLKPEISFIPMGNANVVARELKIPLQTNKAIELLANSTVKQVDIGVLKQDQQEDLIFLAMFEIGFSAKIVAIVDRLRNGALKNLYRFWGDLVYAIAGVMALKGLSDKTFHTKIDGIAEHQSSTHGVIANMQTYAKGWSLTPDAVHDDGQLDTAISQKSSILTALITLIAASRKRKLKPTLMKYQRAKKVEISSDCTLFVQVDGDPIHFSGQAHISVEQAAFLIHTPQNER